MNGVVDGTRSPGVEMIPNEAPLYIGYDVRKDKHFKGIIDEVAIFNVALTEDEINTIINEGLGKTLGIAAVSPKDKLTTRWGDIKMISD